MKKILLLITGVLLSFSLVGCGEEKKAPETNVAPQPAEQKQSEQSSDMAQVEKQIEEAKAKQPAKLDAKPMYRECQAKLNEHYRKLEDAYKSAKKDPGNWAQFSAKWNRDLNNLRETFGLNNPAQPNDVKFDLSVAAGEMFSLWQEYNASVDNLRNDAEAIKTFQSSVKDNLAKAEEKLK